MPEDLVDKFQGDAVDNRIYEVKSDEYCIKCTRNLKGKLAYRIARPGEHKNKFQCHDDSIKGLAVESLICVILECCNTHTHLKNIRLTKVTVKKIDRALKDQLEI